MKLNKPVPYVLRDLKRTFKKLDVKYHVCTEKQIYTVPNDNFPSVFLTFEDSTRITISRRPVTKHHVRLTVTANTAEKLLEKINMYQALIKQIEPNDVAA